MVKLIEDIIRILLVNVLLTFNIQIVCSQIHGKVVDAASVLNILEDLPI